MHPHHPSSYSELAEVPLLYLGVFLKDRILLRDHRSGYKAQDVRPQRIQAVSTLYTLRNLKELHSVCSNADSARKGISGSGLHRDPLKVKECFHHPVRGYFQGFFRVVHIQSLQDKHW